MVNFGIIKSQVSQLLGEHYLNNQHSTAETVYRDYMRTIRQSPILMLEYIVFKNLERKGVLRESACKYIDDNIALLKDYSRKEIIQENEKLSRFAQKSINTSWEDKIMMENIQTLVLESAGANKFPNITKLHDSISFLMESVTTVDKEKIDIDNDDDSEAVLEGFNLEDTYKTAYKLFNEKYKGLDEGEQTLLTHLHENDARSFFEEMKKRVIEVIKENAEDQALCQDVVNEIESREYNAETLTEDIVELYDLIN